MWYRNKMARPLEFDSKKAIEAAMKVFWKEGYKKASIQSLLKVMKLGESSFYNTFKSKRNLYLKCLEYYNKETTFKRAESLASNKPVKERIHDFFDIIFDDMSSRGSIHGCLMTNSLSYEVLKDKQLKRYIIGELSNFRGYLIQAFNEAIKMNELNSDFEPELVADIIITHLQGIFKIAITADDLTPLRKQTRYFLKEIGF